MPKVLIIFHRICHPGHCPPCSAMGPLKTCYCGNLPYRLRCGQKVSHSVPPKLFPPKSDNTDHRILAVVVVKFVENHWTARNIFARKYATTARVLRAKWRKLSNVTAGSPSKLDCAARVTSTGAQPSLATTHAGKFATSYWAAATILASEPATRALAEIVLYFRAKLPLVHVVKYH